MATTVTYNGTSLQTANILSDTIDHHNLPTISANQYQFSHANQSAIPFISYPNKVFTVSGTIIGSSIADCDAQIDTFRGILIGNDQALVIGYNGTTRNYTATPTNVTAGRPNGLFHAKFSIEFTCNSPFGTAPGNTTAWSVVGQTTASSTHAFTYTGTAPYQMPVVTITVTAVSDPSGGFITWGNQGNGQAIYVNRVWTAADVLVIDCTQNTVTVNGVAVDFSGAFPWFAPGSQTMYYTDNFASRTVTISAVYKAAYL